jgi:hypothetical protein
MLPSAVLFAVSTVALRWPAIAATVWQLAADPSTMKAGTSAAWPAPFVKPLVLLAFGGTLLLLAVRRLRQYRLKERYTLLFLAIGTPFLILAAWPNLIGRFAQKVGIEYGTVTLLCMSVFLILMVFELLCIVSLQDRKITTLAQMVGIIMEKHGLTERAMQFERDKRESAGRSMPRGQSRRERTMIPADAADED